MKTSEQIHIETILTLYFDSCVEIEWDPYGDKIQIFQIRDYTNVKLGNEFRIRVKEFNPEELRLVAIKLQQDWNIRVFGYMDQVGIEFRRKIEGDE